MQAVSAFAKQKNKKHVDANTRVEKTRGRWTPLHRRSDVHPQIRVRVVDQRSQEQALNLIKLGLLPLCTEAAPNIGWQQGLQRGTEKGNSSKTNCGDPSHCVEGRQTGQAF